MNTAKPVVRRVVINPKANVNTPVHKEIAKQFEKSIDKEVLNKIDIPKPERKTVSGPDVNVSMPGSNPSPEKVNRGNPNNEPVIPFSQRQFYYGG